MAETEAVAEAGAGAHRLICAAQTYDWGLKGESSTVGRLFSRNSGSKVGVEEPYAELWMGTHPSGPSFVVEVAPGGEEQKGTALKNWIEENPFVLGEKVLDRWGGELPFLFKVPHHRSAPFEFPTF